jgi:hypothetical protein
LAGSGPFLRWDEKAGLLNGMLKLPMINALEVQIRRPAMKENISRSVQMKARAIEIKASVNTSGRTVSGVGETTGSTHPPVKRPFGNRWGNWRPEHSESPEPSPA